MWKSTDGGTTWTLKKNGFIANGGYSIVVDPNNANHVLVSASSMDGQYSVPPAGMIQGIYRTTDGGDNWTLVKAATYARRYTDERGGIQIAFAATNTIYAGTFAEGLLRSTDNGATWNTVVDRSNNVIMLGNRILDIRVKPGDNSTLYLCTNLGLRKVVIGGDGKGTVTSLGTSLPVYPKSLRINPNNPTICTRWKPIMVSISPLMAELLFVLQTMVCRLL